MDNQHKQIKGHSDLSQGEIDLRWLSIGETQLQQGFMAAIRAIARPSTF